MFEFALSFRAGASAAAMLFGVALAFASSAWLPTDHVAIERLVVRDPPPPYVLIALNGVTILTLACGLVTFGTLSLAVLLRIGLMLGESIASILHGGMPVAVLLAGTVPHGMLEVPAFWLAGAVGLHGGTILVRFAKGDSLALGTLLLRASREFAAAAALTIAAAMVECYITPLAIRYFWPSS